MLKKTRKAFTLVELMMVIGILGILLGIVTAAAAGAIRQARGHKAATCCKIVEQGFATYYAQKGRWPGNLASRIENGTLGTRTNQEGLDKKTNPDIYILEGSEIDSMIRDLIKETKQNNPMLDLSGLFVSRDSGERGSKALGLDFMQAIRGTKRSKRKMTVSEMHFGYPDANGHFKRFEVLYNIPADQFKVRQQK